MKNLMMTLAVISFVAACAKKNEDHGAVAAAPQANSPVPTATSTTAPKVANTGEAKSQAQQARAPHVGHGLAQKDTPLAADALYQYSGTADDNLNQVLAGFSSGVGDSATQAENLLRARQITSAKLTRGADGSVTVVLQVPESTVRIPDSQESSTQVLAKKSKEMAPVQHLVRDELDQVAMKSATAIVKKSVENSVEKSVEKLTEKSADNVEAKSQQKQTQKTETKNQKAVQAKKADVKVAQKPQVIKQHQIILKGMLTRGQETRLVAGNALSKKFGAAATLKCYDADGGCDTAVVTVHFGAVKLEQKVEIIFRTSEFNYSIHYPNNSIREFWYDKFVALFKNSRYTESLIGQESNLLKLRRVESFEVINGRSGVKVLMQTFENEILTFQFAGLKDDQQGGFNEAVNANVSLEDGLTLARGEAFSTQLSDSITEARLVSNSGRGAFGLSLKMKALENRNDDSVELLIERAQKKIKYSSK